MRDSECPGEHMEMENGQCVYRRQISVDYVAEKDIKVGDIGKFTTKDGRTVIGVAIDVNKKSS